MGKGLEDVAQEVEHMLCPGFNALGSNLVEPMSPALAKYNKVT